MTRPKQIEWTVTTAVGRIYLKFRGSFCEYTFGLRPKDAKELAEQILMEVKEYTHPSRSSTST